MSGFYVAYSPVSTSTKQWVGSLNVSLTTLFIPLFAWRLFSELDIRGKVFSFKTCLAQAVHAIIYLTISLVLVTGILMMTTSIKMFGLLQIPQPLEDLRLTELAFKIHILSCMALAMLVALHICAVVWHESSGRGVLRRMSFRKFPNALIQ
ncbi:cytochrome b561 [Pseudomonas sp. SJZ101]|nr:cytochrome b561 [Pseudomonas sp. SJZ075]TWC26696.1 cytochrome b561 [Pseudomonas sp. SJZ078]TWC45847.1 cytochrome b561 [Pseudomonas sp. SJZ124]TWC81138.1 cytochrome b561 [Pseudomonas sp. SJZ101]